MYNKAVAADITEIQKKVLTFIVLFSAPVLLFFVVRNVLAGSYVFLVQNCVLFVLCAAALLLLRAGKYDVPVFLVFILGMLVVQLSFLCTELLHSGRPSVPWTAFAVANGCLTVLAASGFFRRRYQLIVLCFVIGAALAVHLALHARGAKAYLGDAFGIYLYYILAVFFAFLIHVVIGRLHRLNRQVSGLLADKEKLIREVHHRITNHLNTIVNMLILESGGFEDRAVTGAFDKIQNRIRILQGVYRKLYEADNYGDVRIVPLVRELVSDLQAVHFPDKAVLISVNVEDINLQPELTFAAAIIVNELITNSCKYAFPTGGAGAVTVTITGIDVGELKIVVEDTGGGFPSKALAGGSDGFGMTLVRGYAVKYDGDVTVENNGGAKVTVLLTRIGLYE